MTREEFKDIAPFDDSEVKENIAQLVKEPGFKHAVTYAMPMIDYSTFAEQLLKIESKESFQREIIVPFLDMLASKTSDGVTLDGTENCPKSQQFTYISNHRDIVLDASFLYSSLVREGYPSGEVALGDNLLIFDWIERLVKLNKGLIVKRNLRMIEAFQAAKQLSAYIHYCISEKKESVWIAQREGRAKDSNDVTQASLIKMLALANADNVVDSLMEINICPVTISYEYDPNDYLKATEFLQKHKNPEFSKSQNDDLLSMETGLLGKKGRIHYHLSGSINPILEGLRDISDKNQLFNEICSAIDRQIHLGYELYPGNYISYDRLNSTTRFADKYTSEESEKFDRYVEGQLDKVRLTDVTDDDRQYMRQMILTMYANPLVNKYQAMGKEI